MTINSLRLIRTGGIWPNIFIMSFSRDGKVKNVFVLQFNF